MSENTPTMLLIVFLRAQREELVEERPFRAVKSDV
jgi:hypothetical protein